MIHAKDILSGNTSSYAFYGTKMDSKVQDQHMHVKEAGKYLTTYLYGDYRKHDDIFRIIKEYVLSNVITVAGFAYKEAVIDELAAKREEDYITKISIQIRG